MSRAAPQVGRRLSDPVPYEYDLPPSPPPLHPAAHHHHHPHPPSAAQVPYLNNTRPQHHAAVLPSPSQPQPYHDYASQSYARAPPPNATPPLATQQQHQRYQTFPQPTPHQPPRTNTMWTVRRSPAPPTSLHSSYDGSSSLPSHHSEASASVGSEGTHPTPEDVHRSGGSSGGGSSSNSTGTGSSGNGWNHTPAKGSGWGTPPSSSPEEAKRPRQHSGDSAAARSARGAGPGTGWGDVGAKRQRFGGGSEAPQQQTQANVGVGRRPSVNSSSATTRFAPRNASLATTGAAPHSTPGAPPLAGGFPTPSSSSTAVRTAALRRDSSARLLNGSPQVGGGGKVRMDGGAMRMLGYPRAPTQRKLDTPVGEYDGTPLGVGLGGLGGLHEGVGMGGGAGRGGFGRKGSVSLLMDDDLAKALDVQRVGGVGGTGGKRGPSGLRRRPSAMTISSPVAAAVEEVDDEEGVSAPVAEEAGMGGSLQDVAMDDALPTGTGAGYGRWKDDAVQGGSGDVGRSAGFVPTPSNRRMGFGGDEAKEVVPSETTPGLLPPGADDILLSICVLAVESIWPDNRPANWSYERSLRAGNSTSASSQHHGVLPLSTFVKEVLRRSRTTAHTLHLALFYLHQSRRQIRERVALGEEAKKRYYETMARRVSSASGSPDPTLTEGDGYGGAGSEEGSPRAGEMSPTEMERVIKAMSDPVLCGRRMFLAALMCASKYLQDRNFSNRAWAKISGLPVKEVNSNERVFLCLVGYKLHVEVEVFDRWIARLQKLSDDKGAKPASAACDAASLVATPSKLQPLGPATPITPLASSVPSSWSSIVTSHAPPTASEPPVARGRAPSGSGSGSRGGAKAARTTQMETPSISRANAVQPTALRSGKVLGAGAPARNYASASVVGDVSMDANPPPPPPSSTRQRPGYGGRRPSERRPTVAAEREREFRHRATYAADHPATNTSTDLHDAGVDGIGQALHDRPASASSCGMQDSSVGYDARHGGSHQYGGVGAGFGGAAVGVGGVGAGYGGGQWAGQWSAAAAHPGHHHHNERTFGVPGQWAPVC